MNRTLTLPAKLTELAQRCDGSHRDAWAGLNYRSETSPHSRTNTPTGVQGQAEETRGRFGSLRGRGF